jgi:hypothetical protein
MSSDGLYFASAISEPDAKIFVWSLEAALERARGVVVRLYILGVGVFLNNLVHWLGQYSV